jgi:glutamine synthetase adenylyltransferase
MRGSMEPRNRFQRQDYLDIKRSAGGMIDTEFAAQLLFLAERWTGMGQTVSAITRLIPSFPALKEVLERMSHTYELLRRTQLFFRILLDIPGNLYPADEIQRIRIARAMGFHEAETLFTELQSRMLQNRKDFDSICEYVSFRNEPKQ